jgi:hypothetical protein
MLSGATHAPCISAPASGWTTFDAKNFRSWSSSPSRKRLSSSTSLMRVDPLSEPCGVPSIFSAFVNSIFTLT